METIVAKVITLDPRDETVKRFFESLDPNPEGAVIEVTDRKVYLVVRPANGSIRAADEPWTDANNARRCALIDKQIDDTLTLDEVVELADLQDEMARWLDRVAPLPLDHARKLHQELLTLAQQHQSTGTP
jgi:hypothetical protein